VHSFLRFERLLVRQASKLRSLQVPRQESRSDNSAYLSFFVDVPINRKHHRRYHPSTRCCKRATLRLAKHKEDTTSANGLVPCAAARTAANISGRCNAQLSQAGMLKCSSSKLKWSMALHLLLGENEAQSLKTCMRRQRLNPTFFVF
jgi:hypothetical protein